MSGEEKEKGLVIVYTGDGKGKTTAALGLLYRASGYGMKSLMVQFMKGRMHSGEREAASQSFEGLVTIVPLGEGFTWETKDAARDRAVAQQAFDYARKESLSGGYDLVVLDEINISLRYNYIDVPQVLAWLDERPEYQHAVLTGRNAPEAIVDRADLVTEMKMIKHPFDKGILARKGVDF
ncbi:MAG: cob(I)yrinic acid a,c-diamide adenosyltransferase [Leptospirillia bacterium]